MLVCSRQSVLRATQGNGFLEFVAQQIPAGFPTVIFFSNLLQGFNALLVLIYPTPTGRGFFISLPGEIIKLEDDKSPTWQDTMREQSDLRIQAMENRQAYKKPAFYQIWVKGTLDRS